ncbi:hypothetical protein QFC22_001119 [Naganishia vaughanmartiniae]|uniref:Uncharacterized protein n=1 Tax=Naganishia vaughanmartiniae TaxID=1424756 RepID=A0ACC2XLT5_9TREE|nr:hypothetical protein QFC22_001119 [Naganishia vaughanmartiniae]
MGRRKQQFIDDSDSDSDVSRNESEGYNSQEDADSRLERNLFERKRKRRRTDGKASAWEGVFGEEEEHQGHRARSDRRGEKSGAAFKPPTFVSSSTKQEPPKEGESNDKPIELSDSDSEDDDSGAEEKRARPPFVRDPSEEEDEEDDQPRGLGIGANRTTSGFGGAGIGAGTAGIGARKTGGGIGSGAASSGHASRTPTFAASTSSTFALSDTSMPTLIAADVNNPQSAPATEDAPLDMLSGIGTASRARLEEVEEEALHPKDDAHAYPQGFGRQPRRQPDSNTQSRADSRASTPGIGGGIGSKRQRAFAPAAPLTSSTSQPRPDVTDKDLRHLTSIANSFGARMLAKSGWVPGKGLGADESGKAVPIEANVGLQRGQGIGKGVRTEQSRRDARARGEVFSSDEEAERRKGRKAKNRDAAAGKGQEPSKGESASWKKQRKVRVKVEHKTYEQLIAEAGDGPMADSGVGLVLDARGGELKEVSSIAAATASSHWTPSSDKTQLPELRHNLRLILDVTTGDVAALAKEGKGIEEKKKWATRETEKQEKLQSTNENKILRLQSIHAITQHISSLATDLSPMDEEDPLNKFEDDFTKLIEEFRAEYDEYDLDEVLVGAISQALAPLFRDFEPLKGSPVLLRSLQRWKRAYRYSETDRSESRSLEAYGATHSANENGSQAGVMTPFESLIYHLWLPKVRSAINNDWDVADPQPAVDLVESWGPILPRFVLDNVIEQLIVPKVYKQVRDWSWSPRRAKAGHPAQSLASIVFPWLATLKTRADHILDEAKIRIGEVMKRWSVKDAIPEELKLWKDVFSRGKWDTLVLLNILPKLAQHLDGEFEFNPRAQEMAPLDRVLGWSSLMRESTFGQLLEEKFFPAWLDTLHFWLIQPNYSAGEVASWYHYWKDYLANYTTSDGTKLTENRRVDHGFRSGLKLMNEAMSLGPEAPAKLAKPEFKPLQDKKSRDKKGKDVRTKTTQPDQPEITFRSIAEQHAVEHNLLFIPTGKSHSATGKQLFKISKNPDGRGGITVYIGDDAVYAMGEDGSFRPVLLDDMVKMASKR